MRPWVKLASTFGSGDVYWGFFSRGFSGSYQGREFSAETIAWRMWRSPANIQVVPYFKIILKKATSLRFTIHGRSARFSGSLFETLRIVKNMNTGDTLFDQDLVFSSSDEMAVTRLFIAPEAKKAVSDILSSGFDAVILDGKTVAAYMDKFVVAEIDMAHARVAEVLDGLIVLASRAG
jgi:hypothetical protein